jgi:hypothetical protein
MSELDLLNTARSCVQSITTDFGQVITITFAMVVAIYYFLHRAGWRMKVFAFAIYTCGMLTFFGMMIMESSVAIGAQRALRAIPEAARSLPTAQFLGVRASWVGTASSALLNLLFLVLWIGTAYLLFFWRKPDELSPPKPAGDSRRLAERH